MPREEAPKVRVRAALRLGQGRSAFLAVIRSRRSGLRSAARRRGAAAARASRPSPTLLGFAPTCLRARAPRRLPGGAAAEPRWPLLPAPAHIPELSPSASGRAGGSQRWLRRRSGRVRRGGSAPGASRRPRGRPCRRSPPGDVAPPRRLPSAEGRARCTGHLGGRLRRQRSNLPDLFAWDLVDPVAYRPIPLASFARMSAPRRNSCPKTPFLQRRRFRQTLRRLGRLPTPDPGGCYYGSMRRLRAPGFAEAPPT